MSPARNRPSWTSWAGWSAGLVAIALLAWWVLVAFGTARVDHFQQLPLVEALARGDLAHALQGEGPVQTSGPGFGLFAVPIYWAVHPFTTNVLAYEIVSFATLVPVGAAAVVLSRSLGVAARSGRELLNLAAVVLGVPILACFSEAFHPADVLAVAACLAAVAAVARGRVGAGGVLLGFAVATRQWAVVPVLVLATLLDGRDRWRLVGVSVLTGVLLVLPFLVADPGTTLDVLRAADVVRGQLAAPAMLPLDGGGLYVLSRVVPLVLVVGWCAWLLRRRAAFSPELAVAALAVALLVRPLVDPAGFLYYLAPGYAFAVLVRPRSWTWPVAGLVGGAVLWARRSLRQRYPLIQYDGQLGIHVQASAAPLAVGMTLLILVVVLAAAERTVQLLGSDPDRSAGEAAAGGPRHAEAGDGLLR